MLLNDSSASLNLQLAKTEFLGKDNFVWWLGIIANPKTSKWGEESFAKQVEGKDVNYFRVKVRIFGYHTANCPDLKDEDLPWAHVMIPPNTPNGTGAMGQSMQYKGGETVFGFFLDGDEGQQPVIIGSLYRQKGAKDEISQQDIESNLCSSFKPFSVPPTGPALSLQEVNPSIDAPTTGATNGNGTPVQTGTSKESQIKPGIPSYTKSTKAHDALSSATLTPPSDCDTNAQANMKNQLNDFVTMLSNLQKFNDQYINPITGFIVNIDNEIKNLANGLAGILKKLLRKAKNFIIEKLSKLINEAIGSLIPKSSQEEAGEANKKIGEAIACAFEQIINQLVDMLVDILMDMIGKVLDVLECFVDNLLNQILNPILGLVDSKITPILSQISNILGSSIGQFSEFLSQGLSYAGLINDVLCGAINCEPKNSWTTKQGPENQKSDNFSKVLSQASASKFIGDTEKSLKLDGVSFTSTNCSSDLFKCGFPQINIVGGLGSGGTPASATAVVNEAGKVVSALVNNKGSNYINTPYVSITSNCGYGAKATPVIDPITKTLEKIIIDEPGTNYSDGGIVYNLTSNVDVITEPGNFTITLNTIGITNDTKVPYEITGVTSDDIAGASLTGEFLIVNNTAKIDFTVVQDTIAEVSEVFKITLKNVPSIYKQVVINDQGTSVTIPPVDTGGFVKFVDVENAGQNYNDFTKLDFTDGNGDFTGIETKITLGPNGEITKVTVTNPGKPLTDLPTVTINSDTGVGAVIKPVLVYEPISVQIPIKIIDCIKK